MLKNTNNLEIIISFLLLGREIITPPSLTAGLNEVHKTDRGNCAIHKVIIYTFCFQINLFSVETFAVGLWYLSAQV
jgi:hypothetical protein